MKLLQISGWACRAALTSVLLSSGLAIAGCGMPGAPLPPSLNLPVPVPDLTAVRAGDQVALTWTLPKKTTDKVVIDAPIAVRVCRNENDSAANCNAVTTLQFAPGSGGTFTDTLPAPLALGSPRPLMYFVELVNRKGRSAGLSNGAATLAGQSPPAVAGLSAEVRKDGVLLHWAPAPQDAPAAAIRLMRTRLGELTPPVKKSGQGSLAASAEPTQQTLLVEAGSSADRALDSTIRFGETYEYRAQRIVRLTISGHSLELASPISPPVRIDAADIFPPAVPHGLAAVATVGDNGNPPAIDLNWQPDNDAELAGYIVYRREPGPGGEAAAWQRISPAQPVIGPGFHDPNVQAGRTYAYAVSAIGQNGQESARSAEAQETVPLP